MRNDTQQTQTHTISHIDFHLIQYKTGGVKAEMKEELLDSEDKIEKRGGRIRAAGGKNYQATYIGDDVCVPVNYRAGLVH